MAYFYMEAWWTVKFLLDVDQDFYKDVGLLVYRQGKLMKFEYMHINYTEKHSVKSVDSITLEEEIHKRYILWNPLEVHGFGVTSYGREFNFYATKLVFRPH